MNGREFEGLLTSIAAQLTQESLKTPFAVPKEFENRVRQVLQEKLNHTGIQINFAPHPHVFPDIGVGEFGIEVKFTLNDSWRSVANSVLESTRDESVKKIYIIFGKMGGQPEVRWGEYEKCVVHVRTSHVPRFEVEMIPNRSLFETMGVSYDAFRSAPMDEKMRFIRNYARGRLKDGERLWWLEDTIEQEHTLPIQVRLYMKLPGEEKTRLRAEAALVAPQVVKHAGARDKYNDAVMYLLTYHGVLCPQARDLFSAGSVANPGNDDEGGSYVQRALLLLQEEMRLAAQRLPDAVFVEYWGESVPPERRIAKWLQLADEMARDWKPSSILFLRPT